MDIKPILGYDELRSMLMVGHEYVPEKRFLDTAVHTKKPSIPPQVKSRLSEFEPTIVPKGEKVLLKKLQEKLFLLYPKGLSTRDIQDILEDIYGTRLSASTISRLTDRIMSEVKDGYKEILGFWFARQESASFWVNVFNDLKARGVEDILVVVSDKLKGIQEAVRSVYAMSDHQKCLVHKVRNSLKKVKYKDRKGVASALRSIYMSSTQMQAKENFERFKREYQVEYPQVVKDWERELEDILTFYKYPYEIRRMLETTNFVESINSKIRKVI